MDLVSHRQVWTAAGGPSVPWTAPGAAVPAPMSWYRTTFTAPPSLLASLRREGPQGAKVAAALHLSPAGFSRGRFYVNDYEVSRVWTKDCGAACAGKERCACNGNHPTATVSPAPPGSSPCQPYFFIPADILVPGENRLTVFDVEGPTDLTAARLLLAKVSGSWVMGRGEESHCACLPLTSHPSSPQVGPPPPPPPCPLPVAAGGNVTMTPCQATPGLEWLAQRCGGGVPPVPLSILRPTPRSARTLSPVLPPPPPPVQCGRGPVPAGAAARWPVPHGVRHKPRHGRPGPPG